VTALFREREIRIQRRAIHRSGRRQGSIPGRQSTSCKKPRSEKPGTDDCGSSTARAPAPSNGTPGFVRGCVAAGRSTGQRGSPGTFTGKKF